MFLARRFVSFCVLLLLIGSAALTPLTARADDADSQLWTQFVFNARIQKRLRLFVEVQPRWGNDYSRTAQFILRSAVGYQVTPTFSVWLGHGWTPNFTPEFNNEDRWFQQFLLEDKYPGFDMVNRTRLEERSIAGAGATSVRLRHMLRLSKPITANKRWLAIFSDEVFWNLNTTPNGPEEGFDQNRAYFGVGYNTDRHTRIELGYLANFVNPPKDRPNRRLDVLMLTVNYNL